MKTFILFAVFFLSACNATQPLQKPGEEPGTIVSTDGLEVSISSQKKRILGVSGLLVEINIKNANSQFSEVKPSAVVLNPRGELIGLANAEHLVQKASSISQRSIPKELILPGKYFGIKGQLTDYASGTVHQFQGTASRSSFDTGFATGMAMNELIDRGEAVKVLDWLQSDWLHETYQLPQNRSVTGQLFFTFYKNALPTQTSTLEIVLEGPELILGSGMGISMKHRERKYFRFAIPEKKFQ